MEYQLFYIKGQLKELNYDEGMKGIDCLTAVNEEECENPTNTPRPPPMST